MSLGVLLNGTGMHLGAWKLPSAQPELILEQSYLKNMAQLAEKGKLDFIFIADSLFYTVERPAITSVAVKHEPFVLLSALAAWTEKIGLAATASTTFHEPYHLAEYFASLDDLSNGRAAWNIVTSVSDWEAQNFSQDRIIDHAKRYELAEEFVEAACKLWDREGITKHQGQHYAIEGSLPYASTPQGRPVFIQAGSSPAGQAFASRFAEVVFTQQNRLDDAKAFYSKVRAGLDQFGRPPGSLKILPALAPILGATEKEAREKEDQLHKLVDPQIGLHMLSSLLGLDLSSYDLDGPLPKIEESNGIKSTVQVMESYGLREGWTIRQISQRFAGTRGNNLFVGTPEQLVDFMEQWFAQGACDGFNLTFPILPDGLSDFVEHVVPLLQRKGLLREDYTGSTLRENLGLQ